MPTLRNANLLLAFLLGLAMLAAFYFWGSSLGEDWWRYAVAIAAVLVAVGMWGIWAAPRSRWRLPMPWLTIFKAILFGLAVIALALAGQPILAGALALLVVINLLVAQALGQR